MDGGYVGNADGNRIVGTGYYTHVNDDKSSLDGSSNSMEVHTSGEETEAECGQDGMEKSQAATYLQSENVKHMGPHDLDEEIVKYLKSRGGACSTCAIEDEDDIFFRSMAVACKKLPPYLKSLVRLKIHQVMFEAEVFPPSATMHPSVSVFPTMTNPIKIEESDASTTIDT